LVKGKNIEFSALGFISIVGLLINLLFFYIAWKTLGQQAVQDETKQLIDHLGYGLLICIIVMLVSLYLFHKEHAKNISTETLLSKSTNKAKKVVKVFDVLIGNFEAYEIYIDEFNSGLNAAETGLSSSLYKEFCETSNRYISEILNEVAKVFTITSGYKSAACIKLRTLPASDGDIPMDAFHADNCTHVATFWRDSQSRECRTYDTNDALKQYEHSENTAFYEILSANDTDFFGHDDLENCEGYKNLNTEFAKHYNAIAVHALRNPRARLRNDSEQIIGFLCIDNQHGGLDNSIVEHALAIISWNMYNFLRKCHLTHRQLTATEETRYAIAQK